MLRILPLAAFGVTFALPALACDGFGAHDPYARSSTMMSTSGATFTAIASAGGSVM